MAEPDHAIKEGVNIFHDPTVFYTLEAEFKEIIRSIGFKHESCIPGIVEEYNRDNHTAYVRPLVKRTAYDGKTSPLPAMYLTVMRWQTGGFLIDSPVFPGDVGWIIGSDRNTTNVKMMNGKVEEKGDCQLKDGAMDYGDGNQGPQEASDAKRGEMHSYSSGFFIPDSWSTIKISEEEKGALLIRSVDREGKSKNGIALFPEGKVEVKAEGEGLKAKADTEIKGDLSVGKKESPGNGESPGGNLVVDGTGEFHDKVQISKTFPGNSYETESGKAVEKSVAASIVLDPAALKDEGDGRKLSKEEEALNPLPRPMTIQKKTIVTGKKELEDGTEVLKTWEGRILCTDGHEGEDIPFNGGGGGGEITFHGGDDSNLTFSGTGEEGSFGPSATSVNGHIYINVYYV